MEFLYLLEKIRTPILNAFFSVFTQFGDEIIALGIICIIFWCVNKNLGYEMGFSFFAAGMLVQALKITFRIDRPWDLDKNFLPVGSSPDDLTKISVVDSFMAKVKEDASGYSFPSGHTQCATALYSSLAMFFKKTWLKILCVVMFLLVAFSRMYLGVHTPNDVIVSMVLTLICVIVMHSVFSKIENNKKYDLAIAFVLAGVSVAVMVYSIILDVTNVIDSEYALDCCKTGGAGLGFAIGWFIERKWINFDVKTNKLWHQFVKLIVGIGVALLLKELPKIVFGALIEESVLAEQVIGMFRYALVTIWVVGVFPYFIKKLCNKKA